MTTSNFKVAGNLPNVIAICRFPPRGWTGRQYAKLAPPAWALKLGAKEFDRIYFAQLARLDAAEVYKELGEDAILLCWEDFNIRCHRRLVAEWLERKLGVTIPELDHARAESLPYAQQPRKERRQRNKTLR